MFVEQYRAFATHGFGDEEMLADSQSRGMELVELQVGDLRPCTNRSGQAVATAGFVVYGNNRPAPPVARTTRSVSTTRVSTPS